MLRRGEPWPTAELRESSPSHPVSVGKKRLCDVEQQPQKAGPSLFCLPAIVRSVFLPSPTSQSLDMTPNKTPQKNPSSSVLREARGAAVRSDPPPPFPQQGGLKCLTGSSCVAVDICHRVFCCPPDSHLSDRLTGTSKSLTAVPLPCRKCLFDSSAETAEISTQLSAVTLNPLTSSTFTLAARSNLRSSAVRRDLLQWCVCVCLWGGVGGGYQM